jgi:hypothetical protein
MRSAQAQAMPSRIELVRIIGPGIVVPVRSRKRREVASGQSTM